MSNRDEGPSLAQFQKVIAEAMHDMQTARSNYWFSRAKGQLSMEDIQQLHAALLQYYDALRRYRGENVIKQEWEEHNIGEIEERAFDERHSESRGAGRGASSNTVSQPKLFGPQEAIKMSYQLDDLAKELGFAAPVRMQVADLDDAVV